MSTPTPMSEQDIFHAMWSVWLAEPSVFDGGDPVARVCARVAAQLLNDAISRAAEAKAAHERALTLSNEQGDIIDRAVDLLSLHGIGSREDSLADRITMALDRLSGMNDAKGEVEMADGGDGEEVEGDGGCVDGTKAVKVTKAEPTPSLAELQCEVARLHRALRVSLRGGRHFATVAAILNGEE